MNYSKALQIKRLFTTSCSKMCYNAWQTFFCQDSNSSKDYFLLINTCATNDIKDIITPRNEWYPCNPLALSPEAFTLPGRSPYIVSLCSVFVLPIKCTLFTYLRLFITFPYRPSLSYSW